jgi:hypothetical protein
LPPLESGAKGTILQASLLRPGKNLMLTRSRREIVTFKNPFSLKRVKRLLPAGSYEVMTDEELIEGLSFPVYRRVATTMQVPAQSYLASVEMLTVDPLNLAAAKDRDAAATSNKTGCVPAKVH